MYENCKAALRIVRSDGPVRFEGYSLRSGILLANRINRWPLKTNTDLSNLSNNGRSQSDYSVRTEEADRHTACTGQKNRVVTSFTELMALAGPP